MQKRVVEHRGEDGGGEKGKTNSWDTTQKTTELRTLLEGESLLKPASQSLFGRTVRLRKGACLEKIVGGTKGGEDYHGKKKVGDFDGCSITKLEVWRLS